MTRYLLILGIVAATVLVLRMVLQKTSARVQRERARAAIDKLLATKKQRKRRQHYVPQVYLRNFTPHDDIIWVFDKRIQKSFPKNVANIAQEEYFYDLHFDTSGNPEFEEFNKVQLGEEALAEIDAEFGACLRDLNAIPADGQIPDELRKLAIHHLGIQHLRTRQARDGAVSQRAAYLTEIAKLRAGDEFPDLLTGDLILSTDPEYHSMLHLQSLFNGDLWIEIEQAMENHICFLLDFGDANLVQTSDHPVTVIPHKEYPFPMGTGLGSEGVEVMLPISKNRVLIFHERTFHKKLEILDLQCMSGNPEQARQCNRRQLINSHRWIFAATNDFEDALNLIAEHPDIGKERPYHVEVTSNGRESRY